MSWSVQAVGKPSRVAEVIENAFSQGSVCAEPEESVRQAARATIAAAVAAQRPDVPVRVSASGSMSQTHKDGKWGPPVTSNLTISVEPLHGYVE